MSDEALVIALIVLLVILFWLCWQIAGWFGRHPR